MNPEKKVRDRGIKQAKISKRLLRVFGKTNAEYRLIKEGDRVLVGLSGGKDSLSLVHLLKNMQAHAPFDFEFLACTVSYGMPDEDYTALHAHCEAYGIPHTVYETRIYEISQETLREGSSFCSYFSRMRRGALYSYAQEHGFDKIALGHHFDDAVESFFMNMFYNGVLRSMPPIYKADRGFHVVRPLIEAREAQLRAFADENGFATIGDEACPAMRVEAKAPYARAATKEWLRQMEGEHEDLFKRIKASFKHIHDDTFLDPERWHRDDLLAQ
ncbi:ATP-binding protein [Nitratifractor sp.]|uniref:ATP-binding protein n=1 Tax=Nitratifractor sp. TaxID=2268144 RepID=UPI0025D0720E|nr:ATP-binding protein [Nitratifractor sp.]